MHYQKYLVLKGCQCTAQKYLKSVKYRRGPEGIVSNENNQIKIDKKYDITLQVQVKLNPQLNYVFCVENLVPARNHTMCSMG